MIKTNQYFRGLVILALLALLFLSACDMAAGDDGSSGSDGGDGASTIDPGDGSAATASDITFSTVAIGSDSLSLTWAGGGSSDITGWYATCTGDSGSVSEKLEASAVSCTFGSLSADTDYTLILQALNGSGGVLFRYALTVSTATSELTFNAINRAEDLEDLAGDDSAWGGNYMLMFDVSLSPVCDAGLGSWSPIGADGSNYFSGIFDGAGHGISDLYINDTSVNYQGLFGYITGGTVKNLAVTEAQVTGPSRIGILAGCGRQCTLSDCSVSGVVSGSGDYVGGLAGSVVQSSVLTGCSALVTVTGTGGDNVGGLLGNLGNSSSYVCSMSRCSAEGTVTTGGDSAGGLVGYSNSHSSISLCHADVEVSGGSNIKIGGFVGNNEYAFISSSYATGSVTGYGYTGGFVGYNISASTETNCYARGDVVATDSFVGGFVGYNSSGSKISKSYSTGAVIDSYPTYSRGFAGVNSSGGELVSVISNCFYDRETSSRSDTGLGTPMTTADMQNRFTYTSLTDDGGSTRSDLTTPWDFAPDGEGNEYYDDTSGSDIWDMDASGYLNDGYPYLTGNSPS